MFKLLKMKLDKQNINKGKLYLASCNKKSKLVENSI